MMLNSKEREEEGVCPSLTYKEVLFMKSVDELIQLQKEGNLEELERIREEEAMKIIESVEDEERRRELGQLHWKMKNIHVQYKNPQVAAQKANELMMEQFKLLDDKLQEFKGNKES